MTIDVNNPRAGLLTIAGVHDGPCAVHGADGATTVAFHWGRSGGRPEVAVGGVALLDGAPVRVASIAKSPHSAGFYLAVLTPPAS